MADEIKLTKLANCAGCGAKVGAGVLAQLLEDIRVHTDLVIDRKYLKNIEKLTLILMHTLDLHVKNRGGVDHPAHFFRGVGGKALLVLSLDTVKTLKHRRVIGKLTEAGQFLRVMTEAVAYAFGKKRGKSGVGTAKPAAMHDAVGDVGKFPRRHFIEVVEHRLFKNIAVKRADTVYGVRADNAKICHLDLTVADNSHTGNTIPVAGIHRPKIRAKAAIDLGDDGEDARQLHTEKINSPAFQRLGHNGVVGVSDGARYNAPSIVP